MNKYKIILAIFFILLFPISSIDEEVNNDIDYKRIFQNTPKNNYENVITAIVTSAEHIKTARIKTFDA